MNEKDTCDTCGEEIDEDVIYYSHCDVCWKQVCEKCSEDPDRDLCDNCQ